MRSPNWEKGLWIVARYALAIACEVCAYGLREVMIQWSGGALPTFLTFYPITILVAYALGLGPGLLAALVGVGIVDYFVTPPIGSFHIGTFADEVSLGVFLFATIFTNVAFEVNRRKLRRAAEREKELELRAIREELDDVQTRLRLAAEASGLGVWSWSLLSGAVDVDESWRKVHGVGMNEPVDFSVWSNLLHPESRQHTIEVMRRAIDQHLEYAADYRVLRSDGGARWVMTRGAVEYDERGVAVRFSGVSMDVTERKVAELGLQQSRQQLRVTLESIGDAVLSCDANRKIVFINPMAAVLSGWRAEEVIGRPIDDVFRLINESNGQPADDIIGRVLREGRTMALANHTALIRRNGEHLPIEDSVAPIRDLEGAISGAVLVFHDVAERRRAHEALRLAEARYRTIVEFLPTPIYVYRNRKIEYVNPAFCRLFGVEDGESFQGRPLLELFPMEDRARVLERVKQVEAGSLVAPREGYVQRSDGQARKVLVQATPLVSSEDGVGLVVLSDVSEQRNAETTLRHLELMTRFSRDAMMCIEKPSGRIVVANQAAAHLYGLSIEELQARTILELRADSAAQMTRAQMDQAFREGILFETTHRRRNGDSFAVEVSSRGAVIDGVEYLFSVVRDLSERKLNEAEHVQNERLISAGRMAAAVAHDFNNLLQIVQASTGAIAEEHASDATLQQRLAVVSDASRRAAQLTNQLLSFSRKNIVEPRLVVIDEAVGEMDEMLRRMTGGHALLLMRLNAAGAQALIDPRQFEQSIVNLVLNARDASAKDGRIDVESELRLLDRDQRVTTGVLNAGEYVIVRVTDRGCGMDEQTMRHLFEPFFTTKELGKGAGLGLATVCEMAHGAGGQVEAESRLGVGTRMSVYLPARAKAEPKAHESATPTDAEGQRTALLVEDERIVRMLVREHLSSFGYRVLEASNGAEGLRMAREHLDELSLVVTDMMMPQMDGREMSRQLREFAPELKILIISGYADGMLNSEESEQLRLRFLSKPFTKKALAEMLRSIFEGGD